MEKFETTDNGKPFEVKEIERKFLVDISRLPKSLDSYPSKRLVAGYWRGENKEKLRIRQEGERYFKVTKGKKTDEGMARDIGPGDIEITREEFERLWPLTESKRLSKTRYYIPLGEFTAELDVYDDFKEANFYTVEVEFKSVDDGKKFIPPDWFGREVTNEVGYSSRDLASKGIPQSFKK